MINILHIIPDTNIGGAGTHLVTLVKALDKSKFRVFAALPEGAQLKGRIDPGVTVIEVPSMAGDTSFNVKSILELVKIIKKNKIDIVHTHASLSGRVAAKLAGAKIVFTRHTPGNVFPKGSLKWVINKYLNIFLSNKVIAVSKFVERQLLEFGIPEKMIRTIYNGIDVSKFNEEDKKEVRKIYGLDDEFVLLEVARIEEGKGHKYIFEALSQLKDNNIKMLVAGDGSKKEELEKFTTQHGIEDRVIFAGVVNDINTVISACDAVVLPSLREALGLALIEGMVMGKPCIASNVDGIPEVVSDGVSGILVEPKDVEGLKNAVSNLFNDRKLCSVMGEAGRKIVQEKFSSDVMARQIENLYIELMG